MTGRTLLKELLPPAVLRLARSCARAPNPSCDFTGDYANWADAEAKCTGYNAREIMEITRTAALKVKRGEMAFERDSVIFAQIEFNFPLLAGLARVAACDGGRLSVLDFGGSLGSSYFQAKPFLAGLRELHWDVVEQAAHVACGQAEFASDELRFFASCDECLRAQEPNVVLLSSVLQYLPNPYRTLDELCSLGIPHFIIDRTAFIPGAQDRLTVQTVPDHIYRASYPAWFFNEDRFVARLRRNGYRVLADFPGSDHVSLEGSSSYFKGFICLKA